MSNKPPLPPSGPLLRPRDQAPVAVLLASALALLAVIWLRHGGRGGTVDIDRAAPLAAEFQVDVNRAEWPELLQLPGIGPTLARRIIAEREQGGRYGEVDELLRVDGIGPRTLQRIRSYVAPIISDRAVASR